MSAINVSTFNLPTIMALAAALMIGLLLGRMGRARRDERFPEDHRRKQSVLTPFESSPPETIVAFPVIAPDDMPPEVVRHLQNGAIINAIKALRDANPGMSLRTAKDSVQAYARRYGLG